MRYIYVPVPNKTIILRVNNQADNNVGRCLTQVDVRLSTYITNVTIYLVDEF